MRVPGDAPPIPRPALQGVSFVGVAYFLTAVLAPLFLLMSKGQAFAGYTSSGAWWSLIAGIAGAIGAFACCSRRSQGTPSVVMSLVFAGAPLINALLASILPPPKDGWGHVNPLFFAGILLAVAGGYMVARYNPAPGSAQKGSGQPPSQLPRKFEAGFEFVI